MRIEQRTTDKEAAEPADLTLIHQHAMDNFEEEKKESREMMQDTWMVSYLDLVTLMLSLFILMGTLNAPKAGIQAQSTSETLNAKNEEVPVSLNATVKRQGQR